MELRSSLRVASSVPAFFTSTKLERFKGLHRESYEALRQDSAISYENKWGVPSW